MADVYSLEKLEEGSNISHSLQGLSLSLSVWMERSSSYERCARLKKNLCESKIEHASSLKKTDRQQHFCGQMTFHWFWRESHNFKEVCYNLPRSLIFWMTSFTPDLSMISLLLLYCLSFHLLKFKAVCHSKYDSYNFFLL